ncbi:hypothetical protein LYZ41_11625 [Elizabethkingia miricola]|uniref:hypothetical protein n=1 Tax=Elizabethkingia miricola TaxID=172045 RepID=UPI001F2F2E8A|nr:hypothetical protein [Elizabethkingia miricola]UIO94839.1 hypothetical protein LYZ41_11625 [Elizabethkingia miricola]WNG63607.1 hypothetical protein M9H57_11740 [Elizabethkingia miricola]
MDIKKFWDEAVTYNEYLRHAGEILGNPRSQQDIDYLEYYKLGIQRMNRMSEKYLPNEKQVEILAQKKLQRKNTNYF